MYNAEFKFNGIIIMFSLKHHWINTTVVLAGQVDKQKLSKLHSDKFNNSNV